MSTAAVCHTARMTSTPARPTSADVARLAGLSRSAVSQILGGNEDRFPPATRERVFAAAAELAYRPSKAGRALVTGVGDLVVLVVPNVTFGPHLQDGIDRITRGAAAHGLSVVVRYAGADPAATLDAVLDLQPAAVVDLGVYDAAAVATLRNAGIRILPRPAALHDAEIPDLRGPAALHGAEIPDLPGQAALHDAEIPDLPGPAALHGAEIPDLRGPAAKRGAEIPGLPGPVALAARAFTDPNAVVGALQAEELLRTPGRRLVYALLADDRLDPYGPPRAEGATRYARSVGAPDPIPVRIPLDRLGAAHALAPLLTDAGEAGDVPVGICCYNDEVAIAAIAAARELGRAVPDQVAVVGADHTSIGQLVTPRLTTVRIDFAATLDALVSDADWRAVRTGTDPDETAPPEPDLSRFVTLVPGETS